MDAQEGAACCYARSDKYWITDSQGIAWESFHALSAIPTFNDPKAPAHGENPFACRPAGHTIFSCCG